MSEPGLFLIEGSGAIGLDVAKGRGALVRGCCCEGADEGRGEVRGRGEETSGKHGGLNCHGYSRSVAEADAVDAAAWSCGV